MVPDRTNSIPRIEDLMLKHLSTNTSPPSTDQASAVQGNLDVEDKRRRYVTSTTTYRQKSSAQPGGASTPFLVSLSVCHRSPNHHHRRHHHHHQHALGRRRQLVPVDCERVTFWPPSRRPFPSTRRHVTFSARCWPIAWSYIGFLSSAAVYAPPALAQCAR